MSYDISGMAEVPGIDETEPKAPPRRLSQIFAELAATATGPISIGAIRAALGDRSFATLLVLFAALNLLPLPPGATLVFGLPLILVTTQMLFGYQTAWLPKFLLDKAVAPDTFRRAAGRIVPLLQRLERLVQPRRWPFQGESADRFIGLIGLVLAIAVTLPIPLGNWLPAFAIAMIGLAMSERDGVFLGVGIALGLLSLAVIGVVVGAAGVLASAVFGINL